MQPACAGDEENGRELIWDKSGEQFIKPGEWNHYEIRAEGSHVQTWINGHECVDLYDPNGKRRGVFGLQIHSGAVNPRAVYDDALVYLDSVSFSDGVSPDITFDQGIGDLEFLISESTAPNGANVAYLNH